MSWMYVPALVEYFRQFGASTESASLNIHLTVMVTIFSTSPTIWLQEEIEWIWFQIRTL